MTTKDIAVATFFGIILAIIVWEFFIGDEDED